MDGIRMLGFLGVAASIGWPVGFLFNGRTGAIWGAIGGAALLLIGVSVRSAFFYDW